MTCLDGTSLMVVSLINQEVLLAHSEAQILGLSKQQKQLSIPGTQLVHRKIIANQRSQSLFSPALLSELFFKGYGAFVVKILLKLKELL